MTTALISAKWVNSRLRIPATLTTVTRSETERDDMNRPVETTKTTSTCCFMEAKNSDEVTAGQMVGTARFTVWLPACVDVTGADRLDVLGATYELDGPPRPLVHPYTTERVAWELDVVRTA